MVGGWRGLRCANIRSAHGPVGEGLSDDVFPVAHGQAS